MPRERHQGQRQHDQAVRNDLQQGTHCHSMVDRQELTTCASYAVLEEVGPREGQHLGSDLRRTLSRHPSTRFSTVSQLEQLSSLQQFIKLYLIYYYHWNIILVVCMDVCSYAYTDGTRRDCHLSPKLHRDSSWWWAMLEAT